MGDATEAIVATAAVTVRAAPERAFAVFTGRMRSWWPLETHHIGEADAVDLVIEPHEGGRWFERGADGSEQDWGRVLLWEPPHRLVLAWQLSTEWRFDPSLVTEIEVTFAPAADGTTRVVVEHRGLEAYGEAAAEMRATFTSPNGWPGLLAALAAAAA